MKSISYTGTVGGFKEFAQRELLKAAFMGQTIAEDSQRIQRALDRAAMQDRVARVLRPRTGGTA